MKSFVAIFAFFAFLLVLMPELSQSAPSPLEENMGMKNALEYLQELDRFYSQAARPRRERERREDVASALMKLSQIRQHYSDVGRPRFGKRSWSIDEAFVPSVRR